MVKYGSDNKNLRLSQVTSEHWKIQWSGLFVGNSSKSPGQHIQACLFYRMRKEAFKVAFWNIAYNKPLTAKNTNE